jgi:hypothetical protein
MILESLEARLLLTESPLTPLLQIQAMATTEDRVLAKPADLCCLKGSIHTGEQKGVIESINGVDTYVSKPNPDTANNNIILFFPDAFGLHINSFLMMDSFAACGYLVLGVDYFLGVRIT